MSTQGMMTPWLLAVEDVFESVMGVRLEVDRGSCVYQVVRANLEMRGTSSVQRSSDPAWASAVEAVHAV